MTSGGKGRRSSGDTAGSWFQKPAIYSKKCWGGYRRTTDFIYDVYILPNTNDTHRRFWGLGAPPLTQKKGPKTCHLSRIQHASSTKFGEACCPHQAISEKHRGRCYREPRQSVQQCEWCPPRWRYTDVFSEAHNRLRRSIPHSKTFAVGGKNECATPMNKSHLK